jgi:hypothetical protein
MTLGSGPIGSRPIGAAQDYVDLVVTLDTGHIRLSATEMERFLCRMSSRSASSPPRSAERLACYLLPKRLREAILGDLEEDYRTTFLPKFSPREARRMYWSQFIRSVAAIVPAWIWAAVAGAFAWLWGRVGG